RATAADHIAPVLPYARIQATDAPERRERIARVLGTLGEKLIASSSFRYRIIGAQAAFHGAELSGSRPDFTWDQRVGLDGNYYWGGQWEALPLVSLDPELADRSARDVLELIRALR